MAPGGGRMSSRTGRGSFLPFGGFGSFVLARFLLGAGSTDVDGDGMSSFPVMIAVNCDFDFKNLIN